MPLEEMIYSSSLAEVGWQTSTEEGQLSDPFRIFGVRVFSAKKIGSLLDAELVSSTSEFSPVAWDSRAFGTVQIASEETIGTSSVSDPALGLRDGIRHYWDEDSVYAVSGDGEFSAVPKDWIRQNCSIVWSPEGHRLKLSKVPEQVSDASVDSLFWTYFKNGHRRPLISRPSPGSFAMQIVPSELFAGPGDYLFEVSIAEDEDSVVELFYFSVRVREAEAKGFRRLSWDGNAEWKAHFYRAVPQFYFGPQHDPAGITQRLVDLVARGAWRAQENVDRWLALRDPRIAPKYAIPVIASSMGWKLRTRETSLWRSQLASLPNMWAQKGTLAGMRTALKACGVNLLAYKEYDQVRPRMFQTDHFFFVERSGEERIVVDASTPCDVPAWGDRFEKDGSRVLYNPVFKLSRLPAWAHVASSADPDFSAVLVEVRDLQSDKWHSTSSLRRRGIRPVQDAADPTKWSDAIVFEVLALTGPTLPAFVFSDLAELRITYPVAVPIGHSEVSQTVGHTGYTMWDQAGARAGYLLNVDNDVWPQSLLGWTESSGSDPSVPLLLDTFNSVGGNDSVVIAASIETDIEEVLIGEDPGSVLGETEVQSPFPLHQSSPSVFSKDVSLSLASRSAHEEVSFTADESSAFFEWRDGESSLSGKVFSPNVRVMTPPLGRWKKVEDSVWMMESVSPPATVSRAGSEFSLPRKHYRFVYDLVSGLKAVVLPSANGDYPVSARDEVKCVFEFDRVEVKLPAFPAWYHRDSLVCDWDENDEVLIQGDFDPSSFLADDPMDHVRETVSLEPLCDWELKSESSLVTEAAGVESAEAVVVSRLPTNLQLSLNGIRDVSPAAPGAKRSRLESLIGFYVDPVLEGFPSCTVMGRVLDSNGFVAAVFLGGTRAPETPESSSYFCYVRCDAETFFANDQPLSSMPVRWETNGEEVSFTVDLEAALSSVPDVIGGSIEIWCVAAESSGQRYEATNYGVASAWKALVRPLIGAEVEIEPFGDGSPIKWVKRTDGLTESYYLKWDSAVAQRPERTSIIRVSYPLRHAFRARLSWSNQSRFLPESGRVSGPVVASAWTSSRWDEWMELTDLGGPSVSPIVSIDAGAALQSVDAVAAAAIHRFFAVGVSFFTRVVRVNTSDIPAERRPRESGFSPVGDDRYRVRMIDRSSSEWSDEALWTSPCLLNYALSPSLGLVSFTLSLPYPENGDVVWVTWVRPNSPRHSDLLSAVASGSPPPPVATVDEALEDADWLEAYVLSLPLADKRDVRSFSSYREWERRIREFGWSEIVPAIRPDCNVRIVGSDDPIIQAVCSSGPWPQQVVFGRVRTSVPYGSTVYGVEEYDGSVSLSEDPIDVDESFREPCSCCPSSQFGLDLELEHHSGMVEEAEALEIVREMSPANANLARITFRRLFDASAFAGDSIKTSVFWRASSPASAAYGSPENLVSIGAARGEEGDGDDREDRAVGTETEGYLEVSAWAWEMDLPEARLCGRGRIHGGSSAKIFETAYETRTGEIDAEGEPKVDEWVRKTQSPGYSQLPSSLVLMGQTSWEISSKDERVGSPLYGNPDTVPVEDTSEAPWEMYNAVATGSAEVRESRAVRMILPGFEWASVDVHVGDLVTIRESGNVDKTAYVRAIETSNSLVLEPTSPKPLIDIDAWCELEDSSAKAVTVSGRSKNRVLIKTSQSGWVAERRLASKEWLAAQFSVSLEPAETIAIHSSLPSWTSLSLEKVGRLEWAVGWSVEGGGPRVGDTVWWDGDWNNAASVVELRGDGTAVLEPVSGTSPVSGTVSGTAMRLVSSGASGRARKVPSEFVVRTKNGETFAAVFGTSDGDEIAELAVSRFFLESEFGGVSLLYSVDSMEMTSGPEGSEANIVLAPKAFSGGTLSSVSEIDGDVAFTFAGMAFESSVVGKWLFSPRSESYALVVGRATSLTDYDTLLTEDSWEEVPAVGETLVVSETDPGVRVGIPVSLVFLEPSEGAETSWPATVTDPGSLELEAGEQPAWSSAPRGGDHPFYLSKLNAVDTSFGTLAESETSSGASCTIFVRNARGLWRYKNVSGSEVILPIRSYDGKSRVLPGGSFVGSAYFGSLSGVVAQDIVQSGPVVEAVSLA